MLETCQPSAPMYRGLALLAEGVPLWKAGIKHACVSLVSLQDTPERPADARSKFPILNTSAEATLQGYLERSQGCCRDDAHGQDLPGGHGFGQSLDMDHKCQHQVISAA